MTPVCFSQGYKFLSLVLLAAANAIFYIFLYSAANLFLKIYSGIVIGEIIAMLFIAVLDWKFVFILFFVNFSLLLWIAKDRIVRLYGNNRKLLILAGASFILTCVIFILRVLSVLYAGMDSKGHLLPKNP
ncbi:MAG: hypothetical protein FJ088_17175, partial [Deltaproteobacteria bacterium]|nr:hypothetical protein [Deltaproteobacteria bacterium]